MYSSFKSIHRSTIHNIEKTVIERRMSLGTAKLPHQLPNSSCFTICPQMDLLSFQLNDTVIWIYRQGNEKVWDIDINSLKTDDEEINGTQQKLINLVWKPDGKRIAIASNNGNLYLFNAMQGNLIRKLKLNTEISCLTWNECKISHTKAKSKGVDGIIDTIDIIGSMPALRSSIGNVKGMSNKKNPDSNTHTNINTGLKFIDDEDDDYPHDEEDDKDDKSLNVILAGSNDGSLTYIFGNIFVIDDICINNNFNNSKIIEIIPNKSLTYQYVLAESEAGFSVSKLSTQFIYNDKIMNKVLMISSKLLNVMLYLKRATKKLDNKHKLYMDYTIRIIELLRGEIAEDEENNISDENNIKFESNNTDPIYDLYDLLLTGSLSNATKKWLTDYLSDRGIKRWSQLGSTYFNNARITIYNHIISSLHHFFIYLTDLKGLTQYDINRNFEYTDQIDECIKICQTFMKYAYQFMIELKENEQHFEQTIIWLSNILSEITTDEKVNITFKTNDITKFLIFISSKLNSIESKNDDTQIDIHDGDNDYSKINKFTNVLNIKLDNLFEKIKRDVKEEIIMEKSIILTKQPDVNKEYKFKIFDTHGFLYTTKNSHIIMHRFDLGTLHVTYFEFKINTVFEIIDIEMVSADMFSILYENVAIFYQTSYGDKSLTIACTYNLEKITNSEEMMNFKSGYLAVNKTGKSFCVLDSERKRYLWLQTFL